VLLAITPAGAAVISELAPERRAIYGALEERYGREKLETLLDLLEDLIRLEE
jgi:DNA-binding MarR family transcriptional regulator